MEKQDKKKISKVACFLAGATLTAVGFAVVPPLIKKYSAKAYKASNAKESIDFESMGPEIVKKESSSEEDV